MVNRGITPPDTSTAVGEFRVRSGDLRWEPLDPPEEGFGDYKKWSDDEIEVFLSVSSSPTWAIYEAYLQLATAAAEASREVSDYDLKVSTTKRADQLLAIANAWKDRADDEDATAGGDEWFDLVPTGSREGSFIPEAAPPIYGRRYTWDRIF